MSTNKLSPVLSRNTNPVIDAVLKREASGTIRKITKILITETRTAIDLGNQLGVLYEQFVEHFCKKGRTELLERKGKIAFFNFIQFRFKLAKGRASEYMKVAERKDIRRLRLPMGALIELSRLNEEALKELLKAYPTSELRTQSIREIKARVKVANPNKKDRKATPEAVAKRLESNFKLVKTDFGKTPKLDSKIDTVLSEITSWYQQNIPSAKKAA